MNRNELKKEYWYDIYGLCDQRELTTIETFLNHFANRQKIESRKKDLIFLIPDISISEKHKLFESRYSFDFERRRRRASALDYISRPEPETVRAVTISQAIELGVTRIDQSFSIYIRNHIRKDLKCLLAHFTVDKKVILGLAVNEKDEFGEDNLPYAQKIKQELESVVPIKFSTIWFEQHPSDSEAEFMEADKYFGDLNEGKKAFAREPNISLGDFEEIYYFNFRDSLHREYWEIVYEPNLTDYFTLGDDQGQIANVITYQRDVLGYREVQNPQAKDVVKLPHLGDLLKRAISWGNENFNPTTIHRVYIPPKAKTEPIWQGHRDGVSNFTTYEGLKTNSLVIEDTYYLDKLDDLRRLAEEGFFQYDEVFFHSSTAEAYEEWLIKNQHTQLYLDILQDKDTLLRLKVKILLELFGKQDWPKFLSYLQEFQVNQEDLKELLKDMCYSSTWTVSQVEDIFKMVTLTNEELERLIDIVSPHAAFKLSPNTPTQSEIYHFLKSNRKEPPSLPLLISEMKVNTDKESPSKAVPFILSHLKIIEKEYGSFCDNYLLFRWATKEAFKDVLPVALKLLPEDKRQSKNLLNMGLITGNDAILQELTFSPSDIEAIRQEIIAPILNTQEDLIQLAKTAAIKGNYFQVEYLAAQIDPKNLVTPILEACKEGMMGIVKILVEQGHAAPDCFYNSPIKYANKEGFYLLKKYLLSKGVRNQNF